MDSPTRHLALYYPEWGIPDPRFMFEALLYWDRLGCIVPFSGFRPHAYWGDELQPICDRIHEEFVSEVVPDDRAKRAAHKRLKRLLKVGPPNWCRPENLDAGSETVLGLEKVSPHTVDLLRKHGWLAEVAARDPTKFATVSNATGCLVLRALTDELTSETFPPITGNPRLFNQTNNALLCELHASSAIGPPSVGGTGATTPELEADRALVLARIARLGLPHAEVSARDLERLVQLREKDEFDARRELFCTHVDHYVTDLRNSDPAMHQLIHDDWAQRLEQDRAALKRDLRSAGWDSIIDKEGLLATVMGLVAGGGAFAAAGPVGIAVGAVIGGAGVARSVQRRRTEVVNNHWTSWLFAT